MGSSGPLVLGQILERETPTLAPKNSYYTTFALSWASSTYLGIEFQEYSTHMRQDAMVMCLKTEMMTNNVTHHTVVHLNISVGIYTCSTRGHTRASKLEPKPTAVSNVYKYFKEQSSKGGISINALRRTVKVTGLSGTTIVQIVGNKKQV